MRLSCLHGVILLLLPSLVLASPYSSYILAPSSRTIRPVAIHTVNGSVADAPSLLVPTFDSSQVDPGSAVFPGQGSNVTYDFGRNVGGLVSIQVSSSSPGSRIGVTFSESSLWAAGIGCDAMGVAGLDEPLWFTLKEGQDWYNASREFERGGFRYLSLITPMEQQDSLTVSDLLVIFTPMPHFSESQLKNYTGWFHSNDDKVNRVWYAGAYTNSLCTIDPNHGGFINISAPPSTNPLNPWHNNFTIGNGSSVLTDGAKRDRLVWPGDIAISGPSLAVSTADLISIRNSIDAILVFQNESGALPYAGIPIAESGIFSFTYHLYTLIDISTYLQYSGELSYVADNWDRYVKALSYSLSFVDSTGLMDVTSSSDWLRFGMGGHNIEANSILYYTLNQAIDLANTLNTSSAMAHVPEWQSYAAGVKTAINSLLWNATASLYRDNETTTLMPQDGNSWALKANITDSDSKAQAISSALAARWGPYGAPAPEAGATVSPFVSGFELEAHFKAKQPLRALDLIRFMFADFMLDDPRMTNSSFIEGYSTDGSLHYAPYANDPMISHAHGWATGPTSTLMNYVAGIILTSPAGQSWQIAPQVGNLTSLDAGFATNLGNFTTQFEISPNGDAMYTFSAPDGTSGSIELNLGQSGGTLTVVDQKTNTSTDYVIHDQNDSSITFSIAPLCGGTWQFIFKTKTKA